MTIGFRPSLDVVSAQDEHSIRCACPSWRSGSDAYIYGELVGVLRSPSYRSAPVRPPDHVRVPPRIAL